jgi:hypothetical protein
MAEVETLVKEQETTVESQPAVEAPPGPNLESMQVELALRERRIAELEVASAEAGEARKLVEERLVGLQQQLEAALAKYRGALLASSPEVPESMVQGLTVDEMERSFVQAQEVVQRIKDRLEASQSRQRVPAGSPPRSGHDLSSLSPREKILHALGRR